MFLNIFLCCCIGYFLGNLNPAFLFARRKGYDARVDGSGNAGASNAYILAGKFAFFATAVFDILKAFTACRLCRHFFPAFPVAEQLGGVFCILGHMFPVFLRFRGGKGLASLGGVVLSCSWKTFLILLAIAFLIALVTNYVCFAAPVMSLVFPGWFYLRTGFLAAFLVLLIPAVPIILKHVENFRRIREGTEARFSYLWNKEAELERLGRS